jgi:hypothetical protein
MSAFERQRGQILPLFAFCLVALIAMSALLYDAADALVTRRSYQNAGDAAAIAGSNILNADGTIRRCSATSSPVPGAPRTDIIAAVYASVDANLPGFDHARVHISCPAAWGNYGVRVDLEGTGLRFFGGPIIGGPMQVATTSTAVNGQVTGTVFSVVELDPWNASWPNGRRGCPSLLLSGGPTVTFDGSVQVNSACPAASGGALGTNGNAATLSVASTARISLVGGYSPAALMITPAPLTGQPVVKDPLGSVPPVPVNLLTVRSTNKTTLNNTSVVLQPGVYRGGIELRNSSKAFLLPGIYVMDGGGLSLGAQSQVYAVNPGVTSVTTSTWSANCADTTCGVLIYNTGTASGGGAMGQVSVAAGAVLKLRAYDERAMADAYPEYRNMLIWQARTPAPSSSYEQPVVQLNGGGDVDISGTLYAPGAIVQMGGTSGGSGGGSVNLTLQFISWDLQIQGNVSFRFFYSAEDFARPADYGLVE